MDADTEIGGTRSAFPQTRHSIVAGANSENAAVREQAFDALIAVYWKPVYKYIRIKWSASNEDAKDLTQEFFAAAFEKAFFESYDPAKARFRTYLRICVDGLVANARKASARVKRGGQAQILSFDFESAETELARSETSTAGDPEEFFERESVRSLFENAVDDLRTQCEASGKRTHFALFERYDLDPPLEGRPTYGELASTFQIPVTQVTNHLSFARSEFRRHVLDRLRGVSAHDQEFRNEVKRILGVELP